MSCFRNPTSASTGKVSTRRPRGEKKIPERNDWLDAEGTTEMNLHSAYYNPDDGPPVCRGSMPKKNLGKPENNQFWSKGEDKLPWGTNKTGEQWKRSQRNDAVVDPRQIEENSRVSHREPTAVIPGAQSTFHYHPVKKLYARGSNLQKGVASKPKLNIVSPRFQRKHYDDSHRTIELQWDENKVHHKKQTNSEHRTPVPSSAAFHTPKLHDRGPQPFFSKKIDGARGKPFGRATNKSVLFHVEKVPPPCISEQHATQLSKKIAAQASSQLAQIANNTSAVLGRESLSSKMDVCPEWKGDGRGNMVTTNAENFGQEVLQRAGNATVRHRDTTFRSSIPLGSTNCAAEELIGKDVGIVPSKNRKRALGDGSAATIRKMRQNAAMR